MELLRIVGASLLVLVPSAIVGRSVAEPSAPVGVTQTLAVAGRSNATASIASDDSTVAVVWGASIAAGATDVFAAVSHDGGRAFGPPVRVNDSEGDGRFNGEQPPRVAVRGTSITVVWTTKGTSGTTLVRSRSGDGGRTFGKAETVPGGDAAGNRGWENAVADPDGRVYVVWLDHRELAQQDGAVGASHHDHAARGASTTADQKPDGVAMAQRSKLYLASLDGMVKPRALTGGVCYCCKTALATGADGAVFAAWRHVYPGSIRDIAFTVSRDAGRTFAPPLRVSEDKWVLEGCPDDGPAMAVDATGRVHVVWPTLIGEGSAEPTIALFYAMSVDGTRFTPRRRLPTEGMPHHPQIAVGPDAALTIAWDEGANGKRRVAMAQANATGEGNPLWRRTPLDETAVYPVVTTTRSATIVAWTSGASSASTIRLRVVPRRE